MPRKLVISKVTEDNGVIRKTPLRNITVHESFVGIDKRGSNIHPEFQRLAEDLEPNQGKLTISILNT